MAYTPTVWATGDIITAEKLNKAERGIASAESFVVPVSLEGDTGTMTLNASWNELYANKNRLVLAVYEYESAGGTPVVYPMYLIELSEYQGTYSASFVQYNGEGVSVKVQVITFTASSADADLTFVD